MRRIVTQLI